MASKICVAAVATTASLSLFGCGGGDDKTTAAPSTTASPTTASPPTETIAELVVGNGDLSALKGALVAANLVSVFNTTDDEFTVFAPTNEAFYQHNGTVNCLLNVPSAMDALTQLLEYHVIAKTAVQSADLKPEQSVATLEGAELNITVDNGSVTINKDVTVVTADIEASNGVVHLVDAVLIPPPPFDCKSVCPAKSIADTAIGTPTLSTLVTALTAAELVPTFSAVDLNVVYTVFAPSDDAFSAVASETMECVLKPENENALSELLTYHVSQGYVFSSQLESGPLATLGTDTVNVTVDDNAVMINDATVTIPNVTTTNGIVHVIDKVLIPSGWACPKKSSAVLV